MKTMLALGTILCLLTGLQAQQGLSPMDTLPEYIRPLTSFGERADWSRDGKRILFLEKTFGDVYEVEVSSGRLNPLTHHFFHEGFVRALYLANGDILLSGAPTFDARDPWKSRDARNAELWVLKKDKSGPPIPLGVHCKEGPAVSRTTMSIAWTLGNTITTAKIAYREGKPTLTEIKPLFTASDMPSPVTGWNLETQNFRPLREEELIFNAFGGPGDIAAEVMSYNVKTKSFKNYTNQKALYDEPEGTFPNGSRILVESNRHRPSYKGLDGFLTLDIYMMDLDGMGVMERITYFNENPEFKASNPVVSDDGKFIAFQYAKTQDPAGMGRGILILDFEAWQTQR